MSSNPTWTSSAAQAEAAAECPSHVLVNTFAECPKRIKLEEMSELFPIPGSPEDIDPLCLYKACQGLLDYFYCDIRVFAEQYGVPEEVLTRMVVDWVISKLMGVDPSPATFFIPEREKES